ncbi:hypothetical protein [Silvimonas sp.]|uniref:hypothetical protein n=1 Tax=Silvimonas sp. TaxID=2650811 RepID=UPI002848AA31|nr:hypothetical protein [Silvimonas sp.]MDR3427801.1 hypothetical protein [Silvimonas sp.]
MQFLNQVRRIRDLGNLGWSRRVMSLPGLMAEWTYNSGIEQLRIGVTVGGPGSRSNPWSPPLKFTVDIPFTGFPIPGMGTASSTVPQALQPNAPAYSFDFCPTPSAPGPTSQFDPNTNAYTSASAVKTPNDLPTFISNYPFSWRVYTGAYDYIRRKYTVDIPNSPDPSNPTKVVKALYCLGVGGSAVLSAPLTGKQYWEIEIVSLPSSATPGAYTLADVFQGAGDSPSTPYPPDIPYCFVSGGAGAYSISYRSDVTTWGTPSIGVVPAYYLPDDMQNDPATGPLRLYNDYCTPVGLDMPLSKSTPTGKLARSIYILPFSRGTTTVASPCWITGVYDVGPFTMPTSGGYYSTGDTKINGIDWKNAAYGFFGDATDVAGWYAKAKAWTGILAVPFPAIESVSIITGDPQYSLSVWDSDYFTPNPLRPRPVVSEANTQTYNVGNIYPQRNGIAVFEGNAQTSYVSYLPNALTYTSTIFSADLPKGAPSSVGSAGGTQAPNIITSYTQTYGFGIDTQTNLVTTAASAPYGVGGKWGAYPQADGYSWSGVSVGEMAAKMDSSSCADFLVTYLIQFNQTVTTINLRPDGTIRNETTVTNPDSLFAPYMFPDAVLRYHQPLSFSIPWTFYYGDYWPTMNVQNQSLVDALNNPEKAVLDLFKDGAHAPIFIGRFDAWTLTQTQLAGAAPVGDGSGAPVQASGQFAQYSGVDLGALQQGDVIMVAADADTGYVWFGKNNQWYGKDGPLGSQDGPSAGTSWVAIMDGGSKSATPVTTPSGPYDYATGQPKYFPAVGYRIGELKFAFLLAGTTKYAPPAGFKAYGLGATVNLPT